MQAKSLRHRLGQQRCTLEIVDGLQGTAEHPPPGASLLDPSDGIRAPLHGNLHGLERITHNSAGDIVERYTTFDWPPLCEAVAERAGWPRASPASPDVRRGILAARSASRSVAGSPVSNPPSVQLAGHAE